VETSGAPQRDANVGELGRNTSLGLAVICDISPACDWVFKTDAGIWKRILMNILGNSLKYTSSGFILVKLRLQDDLSAVTDKARLATLTTRPKHMMEPELRDALSPVTERPPMESQSNTLKGTKTFNVVLTIEDSGKGMSQDYLTHHLFKPFYQEDSLSPGTGLGLSIVHQLVSSIGGSAHVTSELGSGTEVRIDVALERPSRDTTPPTSSSVSAQLEGLCLGLCGLDVVPDLAETPSGILDTVARQSLALRSTLTNYAASLGLSVLSVESLGSNGADMILVTEAEYQRITSSRRSTFSTPLIVLAGEPMLRYGQISLESTSAVVLSQP
jgi:hypothetical protein